MDGRTSDQMKAGLTASAVVAAGVEAAQGPGAVQVRMVVCPECRSFLGPVTQRRCCPECGCSLSAVGWAGLDRARAAMRHRLGRLITLLRKTGLDLPLGAAAVASFAGFIMVTVQELIQGSFVTLLVSPVLEEVLKVAFLVAVIETRPTRLARVRDLAVVAMTGAMFYACTRNLLLVTLYHQELTLDMALPSLLNVLMHLGCTAVATLGVIWAWRSMTRGQPGTRWALAAAVPTLVLAAILHSLGINLFLVSIFG